MAATQTAFQIAQDSEKENPRNMPLKDKTMVGGKSHVLQPLGAGVGGVALKQGRTNFGVLKPNPRLIAVNGNNLKVSASYK